MLISNLYFSINLEAEFCYVLENMVHTDGLKLHNEQLSRTDANDRDNNV
jgi:hypothetical protein